jgi:hypothetical protein
MQRGLQSGEKITPREAFHGRSASESARLKKYVETGKKLLETWNLPWSASV